MDVQCSTFIHDTILLGSCIEVGVQLDNSKTRGTSLTTESAMDCQNECNKHSTCLYWTWFDQNIADVNLKKKCVKLYSNEGRKLNANAVSGSKNCPGKRSRINGESIIQYYSHCTFINVCH